MEDRASQPSTPVICSRPWTGFEIEHDGTVQPCCMAKKNTCGNIRTQSIEEIWNGQDYQEFRSKMASGQWQDVCRPECPRLHGAFDDHTPTPQTPAFAENLRMNQEEIKRGALVLESRPRIWKVTHSTLCNLDCIMCYQDRDDLRSLPDRIYQEIAEFYPGIQEIQIIGGEPFAIKKFRIFLANFPQRHFPDTRFSFVTNGTVYDPKTVDIVRNLQVSWMSVSVDAATHATYAHIRRGGDFSKTSLGIQTWAALGREKGFPVNLSFTVMKDNVGEIPQFVQFARDHGVDCLFGLVQGTKGQQHLIDQGTLRLSVALARAFVAQFQAEMPMANLTLTALAAHVS